MHTVKRHRTSTRRALDKRAAKTQSGAPKQLRFLSLPKSANNNLDGTNVYKYDETAGKGSRVYVIDSGLNIESSVSVRSR